MTTVSGFNDRSKGKWIVFPPKNEDTPNHLRDWTRVRHTAKGSKWGPFTDILAGTEELGDFLNPTDYSESWTVKFDD